MKRLISLCTLFLVIVFAAYLPASIEILPKFKVVWSERAIDSLPPTPPTLELEYIARGYGGGQFNGLTVWDSESSRGSMGFLVSGAEDDHTPADSLGYRYIYVSGDLPKGMVLPQGAYYAHLVRDEKHLWFHWNDGKTWNQDSIGFKIRVVAIDRAGNESRPSNVVEILHDGDLTEFRQKWTHAVKENLRRSKARVDSIYNKR